MDLQAGIRCLKEGSPASFAIVLETLQHNDPSQVSELLAALDCNTSVTTVSINFRGYQPREGNSESTITVPLANSLRSRPSLKKLTLLDAFCSSVSGTADAVHHFLVWTSEKPGLKTLVLWGMVQLPLEYLLRFSRQNRNVRHLKIDNASFQTSGGALVQTDQFEPDAGSQKFQKLSLNRVHCSSPAAEKSFCIWLSASLKRGIESVTFGALGLDLLRDEEPVQNWRLLTGTTRHDPLSFPIKHLTFSSDTVEHHCGILMKASASGLESLSLVLNEGRPFQRHLPQMKSLKKLTVTMSQTFSAGYIRGLTMELTKFLEPNCIMERLEIHDARSFIPAADMEEFQHYCQRNREFRAFLDNPSQFDETQWPSVVAAINDRPDATSSAYFLSMVALAPRFHHFRKKNAEGAVDKKTSTVEMVESTVEQEITQEATVESNPRIESVTEASDQEAAQSTVALPSRFYQIHNNKAAPEEKKKSWRSLLKLSTDKKDANKEGTVRSNTQVELVQDTGAKEAADGHWKRKRLDNGMDNEADDEAMDVDEVFGSFQDDTVASVAVESPDNEAAADEEANGFNVIEDHLASHDEETIGFNFFPTVQDDATVAVPEESPGSYAVEHENNRNNGSMLSALTRMLVTMTVGEEPDPLF